MSIILSSNHCTPLLKRSVFNAMMTALVVTVGVTGCQSSESTEADVSNQAHDSDTVLADSVSVDTVKGDVALAINPSPLVVYDMTLMQDLAALDVAVDGLRADSALIVK